MSKVLVAYYSRTGNTKKMAEAVAKGIKTSGVACDLREVGRVRPADLLKYEGIVFGSPTYYGILAAPVKKLLDQSVKYHGRLDGRVGAAFSSSALAGGGNETTILSIVQAMLVHGMVIQGDARSDHYGPVSIKCPDSRSLKKCERLGRRVAELTGRLFPPS